MTERDRRSDNLDVLLFRFIERNEAAQRAKKYIAAEYGTRKLARLLRSHLVEEVGPREIMKRDEIDELLAVYALLEVAIVSGYVSAKLPSGFVRETRRILAEPSVERFYRRLYPMLLVQCFAARITGRFEVPVQATRSGPGLFVRFLDVSELLNSPEVETFLWMLDDGSRDDEDFDDLIDIVHSPKRMARALTRELEKRSATDDAAHGFREFVAFCRQFDGLLQSARVKPLIQSAFWHFHGYWLNLLSGSVLGVMTVVIERQREWISIDPIARKQASRARQTHVSMDKTEIVLQRLTSGVYRAPLEVFFFGNELLSLGNRTAKRKRIAHAEPEVHVFTPLGELLYGGAVSMEEGPVLQIEGRREVFGGEDEAAVDVADAES
jgi:hypothetical protein